ncbi:hypothetical protein [Catenulispora rubra]|uniref:hypothetical protein n=1 Tax=Catenulispora rubra TaxID=280293 RepID=UPI00189261CE|nr:hypothetical protein [Catenulispora rubra]
MNSGGVKVRALAWAGLVVVPLGLACAVGIRLWPWGGPGIGWAEASAYLAVVGAVWGLAHVLDRGSFRGRDGDEGRQAASFALLFVFTLAACLLIARDAIHEWQATHRPTVSVAASVDGCREISGDYTPTDSCVYHWSYQGRSREEEHNAHEVYPDGHVLTVALDPATGDFADTGVARFVLKTVGAGTVACTVLLLVGAAPMAISDWLPRIRRGL